MIKKIYNEVKIKQKKNLKIIFIIIHSIIILNLFSIINFYIKKVIFYLLIPKNFIKEGIFYINILVF